MDVLATGYGLVEGPVWDPALGLLFSDVTGGGVHRVDRNGQVSVLLAHRRGIGGMALHGAGGLVVGGRTIAWKSLDGARSTVLLDPAAIPGAVGFNDLTTDRTGRIYVGSLAFRVFSGDPVRPGHLHMIDLDGTVHTVAGGVRLTNGLGVSPDGSRLYHADARDDVVRVYDVDRDDGLLAPWRPFVRTRDGHPDGLAVAEDGSVWVAMAFGSRVDVYGPDGELRSSLPLPMVTSVCFGGDDLRDLHVVTGSIEGPAENCGTVYRIPVDVPGLPVAPARVRIDRPDEREAATR